jgi:hypothetical protein
MLNDLPIRAHARAPRGEQYFTVEEIAQRMAFSRSKVRRLFQNEPGVLKVGNPSRRIAGKLKRRYYNLRISQGAYDRVIRRCSGQRR